MLRAVGKGRHYGPVGQGGGFGDSLHSRHTFGAVFHFEIILGTTVFGLVLLAIVVAVVLSKVRKRRAREPSHDHEHTLLEGSYAAVVAALAGLIIFVSFSANAGPTHPPKPRLKVFVTAYQWCWRFTYVGTGVSVTGDCENGHFPTLELPADEVVHMGLISADVVHSMWVPHLRFKLQAFPDHVNSWNTEVHSIGEWPGRCAEFCGLYHYSMDFYLKSVPPAAFTSWLHHEEARVRAGKTLNGNSGQAA